MFGNQLQACDPGTAFLNSLLNEFRCKVELITKLAADIKSLIVILDNLDAAEHNHAPEMEEPALCIGSSPIHYAERDFVMFFDGINFMPFPCTVEIDAVILLGIVEVQRDAIGVIVVAKDREDAQHLALQNSNALLPGKLLIYPTHRSEHATSCGRKGGRPDSL